MTKMTTSIIGAFRSTSVHYRLFFLFFILFSGGIGHCNTIWALLSPLSVPSFARNKIPIWTSRPSFNYRRATLLHSSRSVSKELTENTAPPSVLCVGEVLWDALPSGLYLGGAPTNVAVHLAYLGVRSSLVSCIGRDRLGDEALRRLSESGVDVSLVRRHDRGSGTGMVVAALDDAGDATYIFDTPCAFDYLYWRDGMGADVVILGTLPGRLGDREGATSAAALASARRCGGADIVLDINLRQPWYERKDVMRLIEGDGENGEGLALLKLNEDELADVEEWYGLERKDETLSAAALSGTELERRMRLLSEKTGVRRLCVTRGGKGAALYCTAGSIFVEHDGYTAVDPSTSGGDTVGAGDAFLAFLVRSLFLTKSNDDDTPESVDAALDGACALGAYVASCRGAVPDHRDAPTELYDKFSANGRLL